MSRIRGAPLLIVSQLPGSHRGPGCVGADYKEPMTGQNSLNNFYQSVKFANPRLAALMTDDVLTVALEALAHDNLKGQEAADRLRIKANECPEAIRRVLDSALSELGYS